MLLSGEAETEPVNPFAIAAAGDDRVDPVLVARVDGVEGFAAVVEIELVRGRVGQRRVEIALEGRRDDLIFLIADRLARPKS